MRNYINVVILFVLCKYTVVADIEWSSRSILVNAKPVDTCIDVAFTFRNTGDQPLVITEVKTSCNCMSLSEISGTYLKDQEGTLKVRFNFNGKAGTVVEHVYVKTSEKEKPDSLRLTVNIPLLYQIAPQSVFWLSGQPADPQEITFYDLSGGSVKILQVYSTDSNITATLQPESKPGQRTILLSPASLDQAGGSMIYIDIDIGNGVIRKAKILAAIRDPSEARSSRATIKMKN